MRNECGFCGIADLEGVFWVVFLSILGAVVVASAVAVTAYVCVWLCL